MKIMFLLVSFLMAQMAFSYGFKPTEVIEIRVENTSGLSDGDAAEQLAIVLKSEPRLYAGKLVELTVGGEIRNLDFAKMLGVQRDTMGQKLELKPSQWARDVGAVIKGATGGVSGTATVKVDVTRTEKKPDGTTATTDVKVEVTISAKK